MKEHSSDANAKADKALERFGLPVWPEIPGES